MKIETNTIENTMKEQSPPISMLNTYLGQKGYTILKSELSVQQ